MSKLILQNVRCSYVFIDEPRKDKEKPDQKGKYSIQVLIPKDDPQVKKIKSTMVAVAKEKFGDTVKLGMLKLPLRDGDEERDSAEYEGMYFLNANGAKKPGVVTRSNKPATEEDIEEMGYSGCYFHVSINMYGFKVDGNKGVACGLNNIMLRKTGERLDGSEAATDTFADLADEDDDLDEDFDDL